VSETTRDKKEDTTKPEDPTKPVDLQLRVVKIENGYLVAKQNRVRYCVDVNAVAGTVKELVEETFEKDA
jgi:hypothetical protein